MVQAVFFLVFNRTANKLAALRLWLFGKIGFAAASARMNVDSIGLAERD